MTDSRIPDDPRRPAQARGHAPENSPLGVPTERWEVLVFDRSTLAARTIEVGARDADEAEALAHHAAMEADATARCHVKAVGRSAARSLWSVWLRGRRGLREVLPADEPLLVGRLVSTDVARARTDALELFGHPAAAASWRWLQRGDHFTVTRC
jgi:hypothetical protein